MIVESLHYSPQSGWSGAFPALDSERTLVLIFAASSYFDDPAPLQQVQAAYPSSVILGCSTSGEVFGSQLHDGSISVAVARFATTRLKRVAVPIPEIGQTYEAAEAAAQQLLADDLRGVLLLVDGLNVFGGLLVRAFGEVLPDHIEVGGGLSGDGDRFQQSWVWSDGQPTQKMLTAVGFYGEQLVFRTGAHGGYEISSDAKIITRADGNLLFELDGEPAHEVIRREINASDEDLMAKALLHPLAIRRDDHDERTLIRALVAIDEASGACVYGGNLPPGHRAYFLSSDPEHVVGGARRASEMTLRPGDDPQTARPNLAIATSCVTRRWYLGPRTGEELTACLGALPPNTQQVGFYSYGEVCSIAGSKDMQNQTMSIVRIEEVEA